VPVWQVEFVRGQRAEKAWGKDRDQIIRYLRTRIAATEDPTRFERPVGDLKGFRRYRVSDFRIVARIEGDRSLWWSSGSVTGETFTTNAPLSGFHPPRWP